MKHSIKSILCLVLAAVMVFATFSVSAATLSDKPNVADNSPSSKPIVNEMTDPHEVVSIIVKLKDAPVLKTAKVNTKQASDASKALIEKQNAVIAEIGKTVLKGSEVNVKYHYTMLFNGFSFDGEYRLIEQIKQIDGVADCYRSTIYQLPEDIESDDPTKLSHSVGWINADDMWTMGYSGQGRTIAVIDTGINVNHGNFAASPESPRFDAAALQAILDNNELCAEERYSGTLTGANLFTSQKIPYTFNYVTGTTNVSHATAGNDHGTHVSSICAGNDNTARGVAYNAQIVSMQVFRSNGAYWSDIIAALEDCVYLGVDALNMSLGSDCGFTTGDEDQELVYALLSAAGVDCAVAAGNSGTSGTGNNFGGWQPTFNIDSGLVSSPGTLGGSVCVASSVNSSSMTPSDFSSWGSTADLRIKPEIMAPGSDIYAATGNTGSYGYKSGTSMATPHIAGSMALVRQYVNATFPTLSNQQRMEMVNTLLMCTAVPVMNGSALASVRQQGAGQADLTAAVSTKAYIEVDGCVRPKLELGDDKNRTGVFTFSFDVVNYGATPLTYTVNVPVMTEKTRTSSGQTCMAGQTVDITANVNVNKPSSITVPANGRTTVTVTIDVNSYAQTLNSTFPKGAYIEGFVKLDGDVDLSVPYLAFYGDWDEMAVFDREYYYDSYLGTELQPKTWGVNSAGSSIGGDNYIEFGMNPFGTTENFLLDRASISPNGDGKMDAIDTIYTYLLRNCDVFEYSIRNAATGEEYYNLPIPWERKCYERSFYVTPRPVGYYEENAIEPWSGDNLPDGTTVILRMEGHLDTFDEFDAEANENAVWEIPVTIDTEAPQIVYWNMQGGQLTIYVLDNHYTAFVGVYANAGCTTLIDSEIVEENQRGAMSMLTFDVGSRTSVYVKVGDYAYNFITAEITEGEGGSLEPVDLEGISFDNAVLETYEGFGAQLNIVREPANANNFEVVWTSADESIATVRGGILRATVTGVSEGTTTVTATATDKRTGEVFTATANVTVNYYPSLDDALNADGGNLHFTSTGTYAWQVDMTSFSQRIAGASTNQGSANTQSAVTLDALELQAGDTITFSWAVSSEANYDKLKFYVNNSVIENISGESASWTNYTYTIPSNGTYTFKWSYEKDGSVNKGQDTGWVDDIRVNSQSMPGVIPGDVDGNGVVSITDAVLTLRYAMGLITLDAQQLEAADINNSGVVDIVDAVSIMRMAMNLIG